MNIVDLLLRQKPAIKILALVLILGAILGVYWQFFYRPVVAEIRVIEPELNKLKAELSAKRDIVKEKPRYEAELEETRAKLHLALKQLPNKSEIPTLLENISALGNASGLQFKLFKPRGEVPKNFYAEIPVDIQIEGRYRDIITFFESVSKMPRIVNITNINMQNKQQKDTVQPALLATSCNAVTYKFLENAESTKADNTKAKGK
ncbi:MAG: Pilus assembly protein, PilO [Deltaproteobacteria bacterium ADurb.BinA179]|jgi:type IV pilus assembly protein PilO|nr:type 4a pilus biogenesis protein PilO [Deltaproteobacteria bacterium]MDI9543193.1 type 4a pilus biogenesis protein PilO [Pseudomonadota bacterium]NLW67808.1 type 4a pilus biogenesis protein PilO [Bacteriovoracaceae bacterium]OPZ27878.1 MAG: Pilus assembly protein, PilO [Deltaproteobacteria bacterium ADurb.BinA179]HRR22234.1 type 4a pilus biogenesis protein PilO [Desulfomonilia bacterium]